MGLLVHTFTYGYQPKGGYSVVSAHNANYERMNNWLVSLGAAISRVAGTRCRAPAPSEPCVPLVAAHGSSKPRGRRGLKLFRFPALAGCVHQIGRASCRERV